MKFIANAVAAKHESHDLIDLITGKLGGYEEARSFDSIRASMLTGDPEFCPREVALLDITNGKPKDRYVDAALRMTFDVGNATQQILTEKWLVDHVVGDWQCNACGRKHPFCKRPKLCSCGAREFRYREVSFKGEHDINGSVDLLVDFGHGKHSIVECKIIAPHLFEELKAPLGEHRVRTSLYMHIVKTSDSYFKDRINTEQAKILYISRGHGKKHVDKGKVLPLKEFTVSYNPKSIESYLKKGQSVHLFRTEKKMPKGICPTSFVGRVKSCACVKECWSSKYPPEQT